MSHTKKDLERAAKAAESQAVGSIEESQQLHRHAEQTQVPSTSFLPSLLYAAASVLHRFT